MADGDERVSVRHLMCCGTLFKGRLMRLIRFSVAVSHGSTLVFRTTVGWDLGANAAAEAGSNMLGIATRQEETGLF